MGGHCNTSCNYKKITALCVLFIIYQNRVLGRKCLILSFPYKDLRENSPTAFSKHFDAFLFQVSSWFSGSFVWIRCWVVILLDLVKSDHTKLVIVYFVAFHNWKINVDNKYLYWKKHRLSINHMFKESTKKLIQLTWTDYHNDRH